MLLSGKKIRTNRAINGSEHIKQTNSIFFFLSAIVLVEKNVLYEKMRLTLLAKYSNVSRRTALQT